MLQDSNGGGLTGHIGQEKTFKLPDTSELRTTPFQVGEDDMTTPPSKMSHAPSQATQAPSQATPTQVLPTPTPAQVIGGSITYSRAKKLQQVVHALLCEIHFNINENYILPKCCTLIILRYIEEEKDKSDPEDGLANRTTRVKNRPVARPRGQTQNEPVESRTDQCKEIFITFYSQKL